MDAPGLSLGSFSFPSTRERHQPQDNISVCFERRRRGGGVVVEEEEEEGSGPGGVSPIKRATLPPPVSNFVPH